MGGVQANGIVAAETPGINSAEMPLGDDAAHQEIVDASRPAMAGENFTISFVDSSRSSVTSWYAAVLL